MRTAILLKKTILLSTVILLINSCHDVDYNSEPNSEVDLKERYGDFFIDTLWAISDSMVKKDDFPTYFYSKLSAGKYGGANVGFIVKFFEYGLYLDTLNAIDSAFIQFTTQNTFGPDVDEEMSLEMYKYTSTLVNDSINVSDYWRNPTSENMEYLDLVTFNTQDSAKTYIEVPVELFEEWRTDEENGGLFFQMGESDDGGILELGSSFLSIAQQPRLIFYRNIIDTTNNADTLITVSDTMFTVINGTVFNYDETAGTALSRQEEEIFVSSGVTYNSLLKFDFNSLPDKAIFYSADLVLTVDESNEFDNPSSTSKLLILAVESIDNQDFSYLPSNSYLLDINETGLTAFNGTTNRSFAGEMLHGIKNDFFGNEWLELAPQNAAREFSVKKFYGAKAAGELAPRIIVKHFNTDLEGN